MSIRSNNPRTPEQKSERRRKKLMRQERRVKRLNEPLSAWLCRVLRPVTVAATPIMGVLEVRNSIGLAPLSMLHRTFLTLFGFWTMLGIIWASAAAIRLNAAVKSHDEEARDLYRRDLIILLFVTLLLGAGMLFTSMLL